MEFLMKAYRQTEFELTLRGFGQKNNFFAGKADFSFKGETTIARVSDQIIGKLTKEQLDELKAIQ